MVEYRPLPEDDRETFHDYTSYAFSPEDGPPAYDPDELPEGAKLGAHRGLYPDGAGADAEPLSVCRHHWFDAQVRGDTHPAPGLSAVATPPEHRRRGYVCDALEGSLAEYRERGARFSLLWPFAYRFYRQYGWDVGHRRHALEFDPSVLSFAAAGGGAGEFRPVDADQYATLESVYESTLGDYGTALERSPEWWRHRILSGRRTDPFAYAWERDGDARGYLVYTVEEDDGKTLRVRELAYRDREAALALLSFCRDHDSQVDAVRVDVPTDARLLDLFGKPDEVDLEMELGAMVRIVDVAATLAALSYPDVEANLVLAVDDPLVEWNDGRFALEVARSSGASEGGGTVRCEPTTADPDARIDVAALSQLAVGVRSAPDLAWAGRLEAPSDGTVDALERLFPPRPTYLADGF